MWGPHETARVLIVPFVAAEILNTLVGSFGVVAVAPFTALITGLLYRDPSRRAEAASDTGSAGVPGRVG
jgi:uncharacterized membrane protein